MSIDSDFDCKGEVLALRKEFAEREVQIQDLKKEVRELKYESANHRDRDVKIMGILSAMAEALEMNTRATASMKKQINKLFVLTKKEVTRERRTTARSITTTQSRA